MKALFRVVLVPHDFSLHATRALRLAARLAGPRGRLIVLHVVPEFRNAVAQRARLAGARRRLARVVARALGRGDGPAAVCRVEAGDPFRRIAAAARGADSIVISTLGRTGLPRLVIGSVAEKVVRHAPVPVLSLRPPARRGQP